MAKIFNPFGGIEMTDVARWQYKNPQATVWEFPAHAWGWAAKLPGDPTGRYWLDIQGYLKAKYGENMRLVMKGMGGGDWARFDPYPTDYAIVPVVLVASDHTWDVAGVKSACALYEKNIAYCANFYQRETGKVFRQTKPLVIPSSRNVAQWKAIYDDSADRYDLYKACEEELDNWFDEKLNDNIVYLVTQYTGNTPAWDKDAAGGRLDFGKLAVVSSFACCQEFIEGSATGTDNAIPYAITHELGHAAFDLQHTDPTRCSAAEYNRAVMRSAYPPDAGFVAYEKALLLQSPFLVFP